MAIHTISGDNRYRIFYNDGGALTIKDLTMTKGRVEGDFIRNKDGTIKVTSAQPIGGVIINLGELNITNSSFSHNSADKLGGAIYNLKGELSITDSSFSGNSADRGGAIVNEGELSISSSAFSDNSADRGVGGAIGNGGELSIVNSSFSHNSAALGGGAIHNRGLLSISDSSFSHNSAAVSGAIENYDGTLSIVSSSFSDNSAKVHSGAITNGGLLSISDSSFSGNSADRGGAINNGDELSITNSTFSGNSAEEGGAIDNWEAGELSITNSTFSGNSAEYGAEEGGAIANGGELSITNSTFSGNSAEGGGAIFNGENGKLRMRNSIIAGRGGACHSDNRPRLNISNFIEDGSCTPAFEGDPMLGELVEPEDGSPAYYPLLEGSPAIDAADDEYCPDTDMLGTARPQGAACDIGAYERPQ